MKDNNDELYEKALEIVVRHGKASPSMLQRRLSIGYARAARIVDQMQQDGIVGEKDESDLCYPIIASEKIKDIWKRIDENEKEVQIVNKKKYEQDYWEKAKSYENYDQLVYFPWVDVMNCYENNESDYRYRSAYDFKNDPKNKDIKCEKCGNTLENLRVLYFKSPGWTWEEMCGRAGWLVLCENCKKQVHFQMELMN